MPWCFATLRQFIDRRIPFLDRDDLLPGNLGQNFAKSPDAALVGRIKGRSALSPELFQTSRVESGGALFIPPRKDDLEQIVAIFAAKSVGQRGSSAAYAAEFRYTLARFDSRFCHSEKVQE
jgi:hypothetical protein